MDDEYEKKYMTGDGQVLFREKQIMPGWMRAFVFLAMVFGAMALVGTAISTGSWIPALTALVYIPATLFLLLLTTLRVTVTDEDVKVHYGIFGPEIELENIVEAKADTYTILEYGGWGIRYSLLRRSWMYNVFGDKGNCVTIKHKTPSGGVRTTRIGSQKAEQLANAINVARSGDFSFATDQSATNVSLDLDSAEVDEDVVDVQQQQEEVVGS